MRRNMLGSQQTRVPCPKPSASMLESMHCAWLYHTSCTQYNNVVLATVLLEAHVRWVEDNVGMRNVVSVLYKRVQRRILRASRWPQAKVWN